MFFRSTQEPFDSPEIVRAALQAGAVGYLAKATMSTTALLRAVQQALSGEPVPASAEMAETPVQDAPPPAESAAGNLSLRQREIVALVAQGMTNAAIADALGLSHRTVENHLAQIFKILDIGSRSQLVRFAVDRAIDRYPWIGQSATIMSADIDAFSHPGRDDADQLNVRSAMYEILRHAFTESGVPWSAGYLEDRGDGALIVVPPAIPAGPGRGGGQHLIG